MLIGKARATWLAIAATAIGLTASGCGSSQSGGGGDKPIVLGTTDKVNSFDPAKGYGSGDGALMNALYQNLLYTPPRGSEPVPQLAKSCDFTDSKTYKCTMRSGLKFSNGKPLTAKDAAFSIERTAKINDPNGGAYLLEPLKSVEAPDDSTVIFHLKRPTVTWPDVVASPMCMIIPRGSFSPTKIHANDATVVGSGAYKLTKYTQGQIAVFKPNAYYMGPKPKNSGITFLYYQTPSSLRIAFQHGDVDALIAWRSLATSDIKSLAKVKGTQVIQIPGVDGRYLNFNVTKPPVNQAAVRQAVAYVIDREALSRDVLANSVKPMYAITPSGVPGATTQPFADAYGKAPDLERAQAVLEKAGIKPPVALTLWFTPSHLGTTASDEYTELSRQLQASKLFKISLQSTEWEQYADASTNGSYQAYEAAWYPDYADADNYLAGLLGGGWTTHYANPQVKRLLHAEQGSTNEAQRTKVFAEMERHAASDVPVIPLYQSNYTMVAQADIGGIAASANILFALDYSQWTRK